MKYNDEIVGSQYELREIIILNWIEHFTSDEEERKAMRMNLQCYLQQEIWKELEGMELADVREIKNKSEKKMKYKIYVTNGGVIGITNEHTSLTNWLFDSLAEAKTFCLDRWVNNKISCNNIRGEYAWKGKKYPSYEDYVMSIRVDEIADSMDFDAKIDDIRERIQEIKVVAESLRLEVTEWVGLANHFKKELK
jgi:hypothetical protein